MVGIKAGRGAEESEEGEEPVGAIAWGKCSAMKAAKGQVWRGVGQPPALRPVRAAVQRGAAVSSRQAVLAAEIGVVGRPVRVRER